MSPTQMAYGEWREKAPHITISPGWRLWSSFYLSLLLSHEFSSCLCRMDQVNIRFIRRIHPPSRYWLHGHLEVMNLVHKPTAAWILKSWQAPTRLWPGVTGNRENTLMSCLVSFAYHRCPIPGACAYGQHSFPIFISLMSNTCWPWHSLSVRGRH